VRSAFAGREAGRFMSFPAVTIPAETSVDDAVERYFVQYRFSAFPVTDDKRLAGLVDIEAIAGVPGERRAGTSIGEIATHDADLFIDEHQDVAQLLERPAFQRRGRASSSLAGVQSASSRSPTSSGRCAPWSCAAGAAGTRRREDSARPERDSRDEVDPDNRGAGPDPRPKPRRGRGADRGGARSCLRARRGDSRPQLPGAGDPGPRRFRR
jgi:CBS domain